MKADYYWFWLNNIRGLSNRGIRKLLQVYESPESLHAATTYGFKTHEGLKREFNAINAAKEYEGEIYRSYCRLAEMNIRFTYPGDAVYPEKLMNIYDYPYILYYKGALPDGDKPSVAIVGARECTDYGKAVARSFASEFARMGVQVISGMAAGIDAAGQSGAVNAGGYSLAVLGCGVDMCYPRSNIELYMRLEKSGGIVSEYAPGTPPFQGFFPMRNRIISALADAIVVVEAREKSGSLITASHALEQNRDVYAVPGRVGDTLSKGCLKLIREGAEIIISPQDICLTEAVRRYVKKSLLQRKDMLTNTPSGTLSDTPLGDLSDTMSDTLSDDTEGKCAQNQEKPETKRCCSDVSRATQGEKSGLATPRNIVYSQINLFPVSLETIVNNSGLGLAQTEGILLELEMNGLINEVSKNCYVRKHI